jgi:hypothetical protein
MYNIVIATMNSNEIDINEWVVHNILLGFEHIFIYDDNSNPKIIDIINELPDNFKEKVTINRLDSHYEIMKGEYTTDEEKNKLLYFDNEIYQRHKSNKQRYLMNYFLKTHKHISKYCFFCDIDEFIYLRDDVTIHDYLLKMSLYDIIYIPWIYYGTSFYIDKPKGLLLDNFRCHGSGYTCGKSIVKMSNLDEIICIHIINNVNTNLSYYEYDRKSPLFTIPIHINHYICKSYKSVLRKKKEHCLGQTNDFQRTIPQILFFGIGNGLNCILNNHIMEKYVNNINNVLHYELNNEHNDFNSFSNGVIYFNGVNLDSEYIINNSSIQLINDILNSENVVYVKTDNL